MHYFYVLYSQKDNRLYKGVSQEVGARYLKHNMGGTTSTRNRRPLALIFIKEFDSKSEALKFERYSKTIEGGSKLHQNLIRLNILDEDGKLKLQVKE